jgi:lipid-A-disaccharide synthase-like uncharacterized protein
MSSASRLWLDLTNSLWWDVSLWVKIGFLGQIFFTARFLVQWVASEKKRDMVVPAAFWWLSLSGGAILLAYALHQRDPVFIVGQSLGLVVYTRNLMLLAGARKRSAKRRQRVEGETSGEPAEQPPTSPKRRRPRPADANVPWS